MIDPATYDFYQSQAPHFSLNSALSHSRHLDGFLDRLEDGASVLELGCGGGRDAARTIERGFDELEASEHYDAVWAHACLLHCPRADLPGVLARIHRALRGGGLHYASFKLGDGEGRDLLGRLHNFPDTGWLRSVYDEAGFEPVAEDIFPGKGSDGTMRDWMALTVRKP